MGKVTPARAGGRGGAGAADRDRGSVRMSRRSRACARGRRSLAGRCTGASVPSCIGPRRSRSPGRSASCSICSCARRARVRGVGPVEASTVGPAQMSTLSRETLRVRLTAQGQRLLAGSRGGRIRVKLKGRGVKARGESGAIFLSGPSGSVGYELGPGESTGRPAALARSASSRWRPAAQCISVCSNPEEISRRSSGPSAPRSASRIAARRGRASSLPRYTDS